MRYRGQYDAVPCTVGVIVPAGRAFIQDAGEQVIARSLLHVQDGHQAPFGLNVRGLVVCGYVEPAAHYRQPLAAHISRDVFTRTALVDRLVCLHAGDLIDGNRLYLALRII